MDYKKNINYFENKRLFLYGGAGLLALGLILMFGPFGDRDSGPILYILSVLSLIAGGIAFTLSVTTRSNDKKIDDDLAAAFRYFDEEKLAKFDLYERRLPYIQSVELADYEYYEGSMIRRDKAGHYRTDLFGKTHIYFTESTLCIVCTTVSLIKDEKTDEDIEVPYAAVKKAYLTDRTVAYTYGKKAVTVTVPMLHIECEDGAEHVYQVRSDLEVDTAVENINRLAEKAKKSAL